MKSDQKKNVNPEKQENSKHDLQNTNEALNAVNQEVIKLNAQITDALHYAEAIVETMREPLLVLDKNLRVKTANNAYYQLFGVEKADTEGEFIYDVNHQQWNIPDLQKLLEEVLPGKTSFKDFELTFKFPIASDRVMLLNASELRKTSNAEKLILLVMEDITDRKLHEANDKEFRKRIDAHSLLIEDMLMGAPALICTLRGPNHVFELVNEQYQKLFSDRVLKGFPFIEALPELAGLGFDTILTKVYQGESLKGTNFPIWLAREEGSLPELRYFNFNYQPLHDEAKVIHSILVFGQEVTEIVLARKIQEELDNRYTRELEDKVMQRTNELRAANQELQLNNKELEKINKELESFTYVASHDLQEPLRKIQTFANRLLEKEIHLLSEHGKDYFSRMQNAAHRMQQLITDLLAFSRVSTSDRKFEKTDLNQLVAEVINDYREIMEDKGAILHVAPLESINSIKFQFRQVFENLIGNALKFSNSQRPPHISIESRNASGDQLNHEQRDLLNQNAELPGNRLDSEKSYYHLSISDNGIGFDSQYQDRIFELFQRLHGKDEYPGTGIGLSIVKKIIENHSGIVTAESELEKGSTFHIYLPIND